MSFHLGKPILAMLVLAALSGTAILLRPRVAPRADLVLWTFADSHARMYRGDAGQPATQPTLARLFEQISGKTLDVQLLVGRAENVRLGALFMDQRRGEIVPDAVEVEIGSVGQYFRPPADEVGFLPLNSYLERSGWKGKILEARLAPWTKEGRIFGIPHDVHPVTLTYRDDLFREAGIDLAEPKAWAEFQEKCLQFERYWKAHGRPDRHAIELPAVTADYLTAMLLQRHINLIDAEDRLHLADPKVAQTLAFYAQLVAGPRKVAAQATGEGALILDLNQGNICSFITPDWRVAYIKKWTETDPATGLPKLQGKMRMRPLPIFEPGDSPTSTWGGTMIGIPRNCRNPDESWRLIEFLYLSDQGLAARHRYTEILPPVVAAWDDPVYQRPDPYFGGQQIDQLYIRLARGGGDTPGLPERIVSPATPAATAVLSWILNNACSRVESHGTQGLEAKCQEWLQQGQRELEERIEHGRIDEPIQNPKSKTQNPPEAP